MQRLRSMNPRAQQKKVHFGEADIKEILDIRGFNLNAALELDPDSSPRRTTITTTTTSAPSSGATRARCTWRRSRTFLSLMIQNYGEDLLRYKGVLNVQGEPRRMIFQGCTC
jgi:G3E family GTPase